MIVALTVLHVLMCFAIIGIVLLQSGKGADIGSAFGGAGSQAVFGSMGTPTVLGKITGAIAVLFAATSFTLARLGGARASRVFREPASPYIAEFLGAENVLAGTVHHLRDTAPDWSASADDLSDPAARGKHAIEFRAGPLTLYTVGDAEEGSGHAVIRAEEILLSLEPHPSSARNVFRGRIVEVALSGALTRVTVDIHNTPLIAALTTRSADELGLTPGQEVHASFKAMAVHLC